MKRLLITILLAACGRDDGKGPLAAPTLDVDPGKGEVSVKAEKGDRGETGQRGERGEKGETGASAVGATGAPGKDGKDAVVDTSWRDPATGVKWLLAGSKSTWPVNAALCAPWTIPTNAQIQVAANHGMIEALPTPVKVANSTNAWTTTAFPDNTQIGGALTLYPSDGVRIASGQDKTQYHYVYCYLAP